MPLHSIAKTFYFLGAPAELSPELQLLCPGELEKMKWPLGMGGHCAEAVSARWAQKPCDVTQAQGLEEEDLLKQLILNPDANSLKP